MYDPLTVPERKELVFLCLATPAGILAQHSLADGNWTEVLGPILSESKPEQKITIVYNEEYHIHYINRKGYVCVAVSDSNFSQQLAFTCLREVEEYADTEYMEGGEEDAKMFLAQKLGYYNTNQDLDKLAQLKQKVADVHEVILMNISKALDRSEKAELLINRSKLIKTKAQAFRLQSKTVRHFMYVRKNPKQIILIASIIVASLVIGLALFCEGETWHDCLGI